MTVFFIMNLLETILADLYEDACRIIQEDPDKYVEEADDMDEYRERASEAAVRLANRGIVILDEMDKLRIDSFDRREDSFFQRNLQAQLLKMIEGGSGFGEHTAARKIDTTDVLFILSGACAM